MWFLNCTKILNNSQFAIHNSQLFILRRQRGSRQQFLRFSGRAVTKKKPASAGFYHHFTTPLFDLPSTQTVSGSSKRTQRRYSPS